LRQEDDGQDEQQNQDDGQEKRGIWFSGLNLPDAHGVTSIGRNGRKHISASFLGSEGGRKMLTTFRC